MLAVGGAIDEVAKSIYWTDNIDGAIYRCNVADCAEPGDRQNVTPPELDFVVGFEGIDLDIENGHMYWADATNNWILRADLDGENVKVLLHGPPRIVGNDPPNDSPLWPDLVTPRDVELDLVAGKIYFGTEMPGNGRMNVGDLSNTDPPTITDPTWIVERLADPNGITLDLVNGRIYWTDALANKIQYCTLQNCSEPKDIMLIGLPSVIGPEGIDLDIQNDHIYWADASNNWLLRSGLEGDNVTVILHGDPPDPVNPPVPPNESQHWEGLVTPRDLQLDLIAGKIYFVTEATDNGKINVWDIDSIGAPTETDPKTIVDGLSDPNGIALGPEILSSIHGSKFNDLDGDGLRDPGEVGLAGWTIYIDSNENEMLDAGEPSRVTMDDDPTTDGVDETGTYWLTDVPIGQHLVREVPQAGWTQTATPGPYVYTRIADTTQSMGADPFTSFNPPNINDLGRVAFFARDNSTTNGRQWVFTSDGGNLTTMLDVTPIHGCNAAVRDALFGCGTAVTAPSINNAGTVAFHGLGLGEGAPTSRVGTYVITAPGVLKPLMEGDNYPHENFGGMPSINDDGSVAFAYYPVFGQIEYYIARPDGSLERVEDARFRGEPIPSYKPVVINNDGAVAYFKVIVDEIDFGDDKNDEGLFVLQPNGAPQQVDDETDESCYGVSQRLLAMDDIGRVLVHKGRDLGSAENYCSIGFDDSNELVLWDPVGGISITLIDTASPFTFFASLSLNNADTAAILGYFNDAADDQGIYLLDIPGPNPDPISRPVVQTGDVLFGSTVTRLWMREEALNDNGQLAFMALAGGTLGIYRAEPWTGTVNITVPGQAIGGVNFGNHLLPGIHGTKWNDLDGNRVRDAGEPGVEGWTIFLDENGNGRLDGGEVSTMTDTSGRYAFVDLDAGMYSVAEEPGMFWRQTFPMGQGIHDVDLAVGEAIMGVDFGNQCLLRADLTCNGFVDFEDLTILLANWNQNVGPELGNIVDPLITPVNFNDLTALLADWTGPGPGPAPGVANGQLAVAAGSVGRDDDAAGSNDEREVAAGAVFNRLGRRDSSRHLGGRARRAELVSPLRRLQAVAVDRAMGERDEVTTRRDDRTTRRFIRDPARFLAGGR